MEPVLAAKAAADRTREGDDFPFFHLPGIRTHSFFIKKKHPASQRQRKRKMQNHPFFIHSSKHCRFTYNVSLLESQTKVCLTKVYVCSGQIKMQKEECQRDVSVWNLWIDKICELVYFFGVGFIESLCKKLLHPSFQWIDGCLWLDTIHPLSIKPSIHSSIHLSGELQRELWHICVAFQEKHLWYWNIYAIYLEYICNIFIHLQYIWNTSAIYLEYICVLFQEKHLWYWSSLLSSQTTRTLCRLVFEPDGNLQLSCSLAAKKV